MPIVAQKSINGLMLGDIRAFPFRSAVLAKYGWYYCNGDKYALASDQGKVLNSFDSQYKSDMGITVASNQINLPKLIYSDGRFYFIRGGEVPGVAQDDAIRNIDGEFNFMFTAGTSYNYTGPFKRRTSGAYAGRTFQGANDSTLNIYYGIEFDPSLMVPTANENRPLNFTMVYAVYLGVESA
jgi:hypothetical protein